VTVTVLQLSDTHLTDDPSGQVNGRDPEARPERVLRAWSADGRQADLVVLTGDNADDGSLAACRRLAEMLSGLGAPVVAVAGNHDLAGSVSTVFGPDTLFEVGAWRVVGLATERPGQVHGTLDVDAALARLDHLDTRPTVVALHHPPVTTSTNPMFQLGGAEDLLAGLARRRHVRAVVSGHLHEAFSFTGAGGLALLGAPSTLYGIRHEGDRYRLSADSPTGARVLTLEDDGICTSELLEA
jgi:Icc protein